MSHMTIKKSSTTKPFTVGRESPLLRSRNTSVLFSDRIAHFVRGGKAPYEIQSGWKCSGIQQETGNTRVSRKDVFTRGVFSDGRLRLD